MAAAAQATDAEAAAAKAAKAKILEGVDFIETEEDAEAVESAVVKIQSTFRGKKIRSKLNSKPAAPTTTTDSNSAAGQSSGGAKKEQEADQRKDADRDEEELKKGVATMQVNDNNNNNNNNNKPAASAAAPNELLANLPEDEVERAATKIQAGFKGYKTRKELEAKHGANSASGQQMASAEQAEAK